MKRKKLGLIVNPIAGMGGKVGLKGTDGAEILAKARALGATPLSPTRAVLALKRIAASPIDIELLAGPGAMGEDEAKTAGLVATVVGQPARGATGAADTKAAARAMARAGVDLLLFAGGDGTARDVFDVIGDRRPVLGIPTGVKIHSAVFATSPESAGNLAVHYLEGEAGAILLRDAEVMDIDEQAVRANHVSARLYGYARVPYRRSMLQGPKSASVNEEAVMADLCGYVARQMERDCLYIVGPGTTTQRVMTMLGLKGTLLGVDAVKNGTLVGADLNEAAILGLLDGARAKILVTVIGGQGYLFGRGNQQISADVIRRIGRDNIVVVATMNKLLALEGRPLLVDTGDAAADRMLAGYVKVVIGPEQSTLLKIAS